jgi:hypothetical protein
MPPHRDWTRHGVGRALLWWPFTAFVAVAAFPALAVPGVVVSGALLIVVGLVGGAVRLRRRIQRLRQARQAVTPFAPRAVREALPSPRRPRSAHAHAAVAADADAEGDHRVELQGHAA